MMRFAREPEHWMAQIEQLVQQLSVDRDRLMKFVPQIPDGEVGNAFSGPVDPVNFTFPTGAVQSGSPNLASGSPQSGT